MHARIVLCILLFSTSVGAQNTPPVIPATAQRYLDILIKRPQPGTIFERFYAAWLEEGTTAELGDYLGNRARQSSATAADHLLLAVFHSHRGDDSAALAAYEGALKMDPGNAAAWIERSRLEARALDFAAALKSLDEAAKAKTDAALTIEIGKLRGRALLRLGKNEGALSNWQQLAAAHADDEDLAEEMIDLLTDEGQYEAALEAAQTLVKRSSDPVAKILRQLRLTDILLLAERRDDALKTLREALQVTGADTWIEGDVLDRMSRVFRLGDDVNGLEKFFAGLVKEHPQRVSLAWQHAQLLGETGQKNEALKQARMLLQSNPGRRDLQEGFLDMLEALDLIQDAVGQARALTQQNATDKEMRVRLATLLHRAKDDTAAQAELEHFLAMPGTGEAEHLRAARLLENWEEPPAKSGSPAALAYARLVETFPASISAQEAQAHYLHRSGQREAALAIWGRLAKSAGLEDLLRIAQALQARLETRTALDLLMPRERDFANEPRFFALLVQLGIANKELERTLPWARTRLKLAKDAEAVEAAVKDLLLVLRGDEAGKLIPPLLQELQSATTLTIQDRCLLAALLENAGKGADAEKTLGGAPGEERLIALSQLTQIFQFRQEWNKAASTLVRMIELPAARTSARVQRIVDCYRRAEKPEEALTWIAEWKKLSPGAVQPWLDESRLLVGLDRTKDALSLLRGGLRKFPDNIELASGYATLCMENGQPDEAERTYLNQYEKTTDAAARLRLLGPLAMAAQQHNGLPRLIENFQQRQKQNRASAQPWLALAEIHRATNNDEERRRCLYEASRLRPQDLALLHEIARSEEEIGLTAEALRTLESAAKLDKTSKTRENIARLQIEAGDADLGYRMLFEIAGGSQTDARSIEQMADTIAEKGEWERVISFLTPLLEKHPKDYRLHYLNAVALEEAGREKEAVRAFIEIIGMHEELPGVVSTGRSIGLRRQYDTMSLPPGTEDWLVLPAMTQAAYIHRQKEGGRSGYSGYNSFGATATNGLPANGHVQQAPGVTESPVLALAHVLQMVSLWDVADRQPVMRSLKLAGVSEADLLLEAAEASPQLTVTPEMLTAHPENVVLHAAWLMQSPNGDPDELLPHFEDTFKLLHASIPALALTTAYKAWRLSGEESALWVQRVTDLCKGPTGDEGRAVQVLAGMLQGQAETYRLQTQSGMEPELTQEQIKTITQLLKDRLLGDEDSFNNSVTSGIGAFFAVKDWGSVVDLVEHSLHAPDKTQTPGTPTTSGGFGRNYYPRDLASNPLPLPAAGLKLPPNIATWISGLSARASYGDAQIDETQAKLKAEFESGLKPWIEQTTEPRLRLVLRLMTGDQRSLLEELEPRLKSATPPTDDLMFAGWLHQQLNHPEQAIALFQRARERVTDTNVLRHLDSAMLYSAMQMLHGGTEKSRILASIKTVIERLARSATSTYEKEQIAELMNAFGMLAEAQQLYQSLQTGIRAQRNSNTAVIANPYSRNYAYQRRQQKAPLSVDQLLQKGDQPGAVQELLRQTRAAIQACLSPQNYSSGHYQIHNVIKSFDQYKLRTEVMEAMRAAASGWKGRLELAVLLEHTDLKTAPAIAEHRGVVAANPRAYASHARLASLLALEGDFTTALEHWNRLPAAFQAQQLPALTEEFSQRSEISVPQPAALSGLLTAWLKSMPPTRPPSMQVVQQFYTVLNHLQQGDSNGTLAYPPLWELRRWALKEDGSLNITPESQKALDQRRIAHDELCRAMLQIPELAVLGFAPLGGLAMHEGKHLDETEKLALDLLSQRAMPKTKRRLMGQGNHYYMQYGGTDPASPMGGLFATPERIAMPVPAVFATYTAAMRGDQRALEEVVFPAILKAEGRGIEEYCRAYAAVLMAKDLDFVNAAKAWLQPSKNRNYSHRSQQQGGPLQEIVRLWLTRQISASLDELFDMGDKDRSRMNPGYVSPLMTTYVFALGQRDPEALRNFVRRQRDRWIGDTAEKRRENIAVWRESQKQQRLSRNPFPRSASREQQAVAGYAQWLQGLLRDSRGLALIDIAMEDGLEDSSEWLRQIASYHTGSDRLREPEDYLKTADALRFLGDASHFRAYDLTAGDEQHSTWLGNLARQWRERWDDSRINETLKTLGKRTPTFGTELMQALLLKNSRTLLQLDGRPVPLEASQVAQFQSRDQGDGFAYRSAALKLVLSRHEKEVAVMPPVAQGELSLLLRDELRGYPDPDKLGADLTRILSPLLKAENLGLLVQADFVIKAEKLDDVGQRADQFIRLLPLQLRDIARIDAAKADAVARHALDLLRTSPEQKEAELQNHREPPVHRFLQALAQVPQLLGTTLDLAEKENLIRSRNWTSNLCYRLEEAARDPAQLPAIFTGTPWVAEAAKFRDLRTEESSEPTLIARLIDQIENLNGASSVARDHLLKQPATFGTELLLAFLHRSENDPKGMRSFYNTKRPDDTAVLTFIRTHRGDFTQLQPGIGASLFALFKARIPDLDQKSTQDSGLQQALQPLVDDDARQFESEVEHWMALTSMNATGDEAYEASRRGEPLLDRLAETDKTRAVEFLDHISTLLAQYEVQNRRGGQPLPAHQTQVAQWLQRAASVPELFGEVIQRGEECGAAKDDAWLDATLSQARNLYKLRGKPKRVVARLEAAGMLDPAATFNPRTLPRASEKQAQLQAQQPFRMPPGMSASAPLTLLETWRSEFTGGTTHPGLTEELSKRQPRTFGVDLIVLFNSQRHNAPDEIIAFAQTHADEIASCPDEQQKMLAGFFERQKWADVFIANVPALRDEFEPFIQQQEARQQSFLKDLLKATKWSELEYLYVQSIRGESQRGSRMPFPPPPDFPANAPPGFYPPGRPSPAIDFLARQMAGLAAADPEKAGQALQHVTKIYDREFGGMNDPYRRPPIYPLLQSLASTPKLVPTILKLASLSSLSTQFSQFGATTRTRPTYAKIEHDIIDRAIPPSALSNAASLVSTLDGLGLLADAATFDPVSLPQLATRSMLGLVAWRLGGLNPKVRDETARLLTSDKDATFGRRLFAAWITDEAASERTSRLAACASEFAHLQSKSAGAVLAMFEPQFPDLAEAVVLEGKLAPFAPLLKLRDEEERAYLNAVLAERRNIPPPHRDYSVVVRHELARLMNENHSDDALKLVRSLPAQFDMRDPANLGARFDSRSSSLLRSMLLNNGDDSAALLACLMKAAAHLPGIRTTPDARSTPGYLGSKGPLFSLWEQRGGWASPGQVFADFVQEVEKYGIEDTAGIWLRLLHGMFVSVGPKEKQEIAAWAAQKHPPGLQIVAREVLLALSLIKATEPMFDDPLEARRLVSTTSKADAEAFANASKEARSLLQDEKIAPQVKLSLAAFFTGFYPGLLDAETVQSWALHAARAWHDDQPVTRLELEALLNAASVLPINEPWKRISAFALERWNQREEGFRQARRRTIETMYFPFVLRFACRGGDGSTLQTFMKDSSRFDLRRSRGILLECGASKEAASLNLRKSAEETTTEDEWYGWLPPAEAVLKNVAGQDPEDTLLMEVLALTGNDAATAMLHPHARLPTHDQRFSTFAKKLAAIPLPAVAVQRAQTLVTLGLENPVAALSVLNQFEEVSRLFLSDSLGEDDFAYRLWTDFLAVHAALKIAQDDFSLADENWKRLQNDAKIVSYYGSNPASLASRFRGTMFRCLVHLWSSGMGREPARLLKLPAFAGINADSYYSGILTAREIQLCIDAWAAALKGTPLPAEVSDKSARISRADRLISCLAAMAGSGKSRMSFKQRLHLFVHVSAHLPVSSYPVEIWSRLVQQQVFTAEELLKNAESILGHSDRLAPATLEDFATFARLHGDWKTASQVFSRTAVKWAAQSKNASTSNADRCHADQAALLIRLKDFNEARRCLDRVNPADKAFATVAKYNSLLKMLPPSPAPAK